MSYVVKHCKSEVGLAFFPAPLDFRKNVVFLEDPHASPACSSDKSNLQMKMSIEHRWNDTDRGKLKYSEKHPSQ